MLWFRLTNSSAATTSSVTTTTVSTSNSRRSITATSRPRTVRMAPNVGHHHQQQHPVPRSRSAGQIDTLQDLCLPHDGLGRKQDRTGRQRILDLHRYRRIDSSAQGCVPGLDIQHGTLHHMRKRNPRLWWPRNWAPISPSSFPMVTEANMVY